MIVIEMNPRVPLVGAGFEATGFPIAKMPTGARVSLDEVPVTSARHAGIVRADHRYVVVKIRAGTEKFPRPIAP
jgi:carbamoylphosphate synthase large subunit